MKGLPKAFLGIMASIGILICWGTSRGQYKRELTHRVYQEMYKISKKPNVVIDHLRTAAKEGYNGAIVNEIGMGTIEKWSQSQLNSYEKVKAEAKRLKIALVPAYFSALTPVRDDPMVAEASPIRGTPFKVAGGIARCASDHSTGLQNGGFESFTGSKPSNWGLRNLQPGATCFSDKATKHSGAASFRVSNAAKFARIYQSIKVKPFRAYRISAWFKTQGIASIVNVEFKVYGNQELLNRRGTCPFAVPTSTWYRSTFNKTMDWTKCVSDFNSAQNTTVQVEFHFSERVKQTGSIWIDDFEVKEVGLYETVIRKNHQVTVKSADGSKTYKEGADYMVDPKCKKYVPGPSTNYEGRLQIPSGSSIRNGQTLKVDWYKYSDVYYIFSSTNFCLTETWTMLRDDMKNIDRVFGHSQWIHLLYDEMRDLFWDDRCELIPQARTGGDYLAGTMKLTQKTCRKDNVNRELWAYNDMYDPYHNSRKDYHICWGGTANSWKDLDTSIIILNWRPGPAPFDVNSFSFYMGLDPLRKGRVNRQIISAQDGGSAVARFKMVQQLEAKGGRGVIGLNWVTWYDDWSHMVSTARACKNFGWWGTKPLPQKQVVPCKGTNCDVVPVTTYNLPKSDLTGLGGAKLFSGCGDGIIQYELPFHAGVNLRVVDLQGRTVKRIVNNAVSAGKHRINLRTSGLSSGVYFVHLLVGGETTKSVRYVLL